VPVEGDQAALAVEIVDQALTEPGFLPAVIPLLSSGLSDSGLGGGGGGSVGAGMSFAELSAFMNERDDRAEAKDDRAEAKAEKARQEAKAEKAELKAERQELEAKVDQLLEEAAEKQRQETQGKIEAVEARVR
jgi:hypothetical protein